MENNLIAIVEQNGKQAVSACELHTFLESKQDFSTWIKNRIEKYDLIEDQDFDVFHKIMENSKGGRPQIEYVLTVDAAKELSMVEGTERGKQARRYFIEAEKALTQMRSQHVIPQNLSEALHLAAQQADQLESQQKQFAEQRSRVLFSRAVETSKQSVLIGELAKIICQNGVQTGEKRLFQWLRDNNYLCSYGSRYNQPSQKAMQQGLFEIKKTTINKPSGETLVTTTTKVTGKGQIYFVTKFLSQTN